MFSCPIARQDRPVSATAQEPTTVRPRVRAIAAIRTSKVTILMERAEMRPAEARCTASRLRAPVASARLAASPIVVASAATIAIRSQSRRKAALAVLRCSGGVRRARTRLTSTSVIAEVTQSGSASSNAVACTVSGSRT